MVAFNARAEEAEAEAEAFHARAEEAEAEAEAFHARAEEIDMTCTAIFHANKAFSGDMAQISGSKADAITRATLADARASLARTRATQADARASLTLIRAAHKEVEMWRFGCDGLSERERDELKGSAVDRGDEGEAPQSSSSSSSSSSSC